VLLIACEKKESKGDSHVGVLQRLSPHRALTPEWELTSSALPTTLHTLNPPVALGSI